VKTTVQRWGNSLGIRIPRGLAQDARVEQGTAVDLRVEGGRLVVRPIARRAYDLGDLLRGVRRSNVHGEVDTGAAAGGETW
jgi:antitoxin MazE